MTHPGQVSQDIWLFDVDHSLMVRTAIEETGGASTFRTGAPILTPQLCSSLGPRKECALPKPMEFKLVFRPLQRSAMRF